MPTTHWPHAPIHQLYEKGAYFVTAATYRQTHHFRGSDRVAVLHRGLLQLAEDYGWRLEAWAVFSNHYHFVGVPPESAENASSLTLMLKTLHTRTAGWLNRMDTAPGRRVWHNYRDTRLTYQQSYFTRLNYVHQNAVKHGLVPVANQYPWCSASWLERTAPGPVVKSIYRFKIDALRVHDDFEPSEDW